MITERQEHEVQTWLQARLARAIRRKPADVGINTPFADLGIDSLDGVNVAVELEEWLGQSLSGTLLWDYPNIAAVSAFLVGKTNKTPAAPPSEPVNEEYYVPEKIPAFVELQARLAALESSGLDNPYFRQVRGDGSPIVEIGGRKLLSFCSYNYLGNASDPSVIHASIEATREFGVSVSSSRVIGGQRAIHDQLERELAGFLGFESALLFVGGHATNVSAIGTLMGPRDLILHDQLAHDSMLQGARLSHARMQPFPHNDWQELDRILTNRRGQFEKVLILLEGIYSAEGDVCNLPQFVEVKRRHHCWLFLDEAHSFGVLGEHGRGVCEHWKVPASEIDVWMSTLSKAMGSLGGVIAGNRMMVDYLRYSSSGFINSVGMPASAAAGTLAALANLRSQPSRRKRLAELCRRFDDRARVAKLDLGNSVAASASKPVMVYDDRRCIALANRLFERGIDTQPLVPPSVPAGQSRIRLFVTSLHTEEQIDRAVDCIAEELSHLPGSKG